MIQYDSNASNPACNASALDASSTRSSAYFRTVICTQNLRVVAILVLFFSPLFMVLYFLMSLSLPFVNSIYLFADLFLLINIYR